MQREKTKFTPKEMAYIALLVVVIAVCSWISIPSVVPFTMQTFGVFCAVGLLGGFRGTVAVLIYILMGLIGLPVFFNFNGGVGYLMGPTGGYIVGFLFTALVYWLFEKLFGIYQPGLALSAGGYGRGVWRFSGKAPLHRPQAPALQLGHRL